MRAWSRRIPDDEATAAGGGLAPLRSLRYAPVAPLRQPTPSGGGSGTPKTNHGFPYFPTPGVGPFSTRKWACFARGFPLNAISSILSPDHGVPDLSRHPDAMFLPTGGSNLKDWMARIVRLSKPAFYLFDRELEPETTLRKQIVAAINDMPGSVAVMTSKRTVENYIHPVAVQQACGIELTFDDDTDVAGLLALELMRRSHGTAWADLSCKRQRRLHEKAKKILNRKAVHFMTPALVAEQDRGGEIINWLRTIGQMIVAVK